MPSRMVTHRLRGPRSMPDGVTSGEVAAGNVRAYQKHEAMLRKRAARTAEHTFAVAGARGFIGVIIGFSEVTTGDLRDRAELMAAARQPGTAGAHAAAELKARFRLTLTPGDGVPQPWPPRAVIGGPS